METIQFATAPPQAQLIVVTLGWLMEEVTAVNALRDSDLNVSRSLGPRNTPVGVTLLPNGIQKV